MIVLVLLNSLILHGKISLELESLESPAPKIMKIWYKSYMECVGLKEAEFNEEYEYVNKKIKKLIFNPWKPFWKSKLA